MTGSPRPPNISRTYGAPVPRRRWPLAPKVKAGAAGAGAGALILQVLLQAFHAHPGAVLSALVHVLAPLALSVISGWRAPHQYRVPAAGPILGYRIGGRTYAPSDITIIRESRPGKRPGP